MSTYMPKASDIERKWYILDAAGKPLGKTAALAAEGCCSLQELDLRGDDLKAIGYKGREIKAALLTLLTAVAEEKCENKKEKLLRYINQK